MTHWSIVRKIFFFVRPSEVKVRRWCADPVDCGKERYALQVLKTYIYIVTRSMTKEIDHCSGRGGFLRTR
jgi:hypothetical protein